MDKTVLIIVVVIIAGMALYMEAPKGFPDTVSSVREVDQPVEGNGMLGRFMEALDYMAWHPSEMLIAMSLLAAASAGLVIYWKSIQD